MTKAGIGLALIVAGTIAVAGSVFVLSGSASGIVMLAPFDRFMAQVGIAVGVAPNPENTLNDQLNEKQMQLDEEQADLAAREGQLGSSTATSTDPVSAPSILWYLTVAVGVLAILVGLNFYMDWRRTKEETLPPPGSQAPPVPRA